MTSLMIAMCLATPSADANLAGKECTGVAWVLPFPKAMKKATAENRLLAIKPIAFGTTPDGGW